MQVVHERCCGLDIHKKVVVACAITPGPDGAPRGEVRTFGTMTRDILELSDWLTALGVTDVAMESTGVYWKPFYNLLEASFHLWLVNPEHMRAVPGRKTDTKDSEWIADLLRHGLLRASFVPERPQRELRELTRYRVSLVQERSAEAARLHKTLEGANIKLGSVATDILGVSGRQILETLVAGTATPEAMAQMAKGRLREKVKELEQALTGAFGAHQRFLVARQLAHLDFLEEAIAQVSEEIGERVRPFEEAVERCDVIPGVGRRTVEGVIAELGVDMSRFPSAGHCSAWAGMCPGNNESAGKRRAGKRRQGNRHLRRLLVEAAHAAARAKNSYLSAQYHRIAARRGKKRAAVAVGHTILEIIYHLLQDPTRQYQDLGPRYFDSRNQKAVERSLVQRLEALGNRVTLEKVLMAA